MVKDEAYQQGMRDAATTLPPPPRPHEALAQGNAVDSMALRRDAEQQGLDPNTYIPQDPNARVGGGFITYDHAGNATHDVHDWPPPAPGTPPNAAAEQFLNSLQPHTYTWKPGAEAAAPNPQAAQNPNLGIMAQDVEKSPWGNAIVQQGPGGVKQLDMKALTSALAAGSGALKDKQDDHESRLAALETFMNRKTLGPKAR